MMNADASTRPDGQGSGAAYAQPERDMRLRSPPSAGRISYAESVYEAPPPAYDAIDFSVPPVPSLPSRSTVQAPAPLPVPPAQSGGEGQRA